MILPGAGRGTSAAGGGGASLRKPEVYAARKLRRSMSLPEVMLWQAVRASKLGFKVRRQHPIGPYVADFYVPCSRLVIEIDGESHGRGLQPSRDEKRNHYMQTVGYTVLRLVTSDVMNDMDGVTRLIASRVASPLHHPADGPPPHAGEEV